MGTISAATGLSGALSSTEVLHGEVSSTCVISGSIAVNVDDEASYYEGDTSVSPKAFESTVLATNRKRMRSDVTVLEIPYAKVDNDSGGSTVTIGG